MAVKFSTPATRAALSAALLLLASCALAAREPMKPVHGWKTVHVWVGNETSEMTSPFYSPRSAPSSHSQRGQDKTVAKLYGDDKRGFFVDLAANDAVFLSNTLMLERDYGWDGICIEGNPIYWAKLSRRKCMVVGAVVGKVDDQVVTFNDRNVDPDNAEKSGAWGGIAGIEEIPDNFKRVKGFRAHTAKLLSVFEKARVPQTIDYMSFDVEGAEWFIAQFFPWTDYQVNLLTVERPNQNLQEMLKKIGMVYLLDHGGDGDQMWCHKSKEKEFKEKLDWQVPQKNKHNQYAFP